VLPLSSGSKVSQSREQSKLCLRFAIWMAYSLTLKMEVVHSFRILINFYQKAWYHIPTHSTLYSYHSDSLICVLFLFNWYSRGGFQFGSLSTAATNRPILPAPGDHDDGEIGGMIGRGNQSTWRKPALVLLCPPQTPHAARTQTWATAVRNQRLIAWTTAWPSLISYFLRYF
jgi:hypothetical protein